MSETRILAGRAVGRYFLHDEIASGGMASIHLGRLQGPVGFSRTVAIKRLHAQYARDPEFVSMFLDEARLAARIQHPNVVATIDVIALGGELFLVMDYIQGETLSRLQRALRERGTKLPLHIGVAIVADALSGLHAAHEATTEQGEPLAIVHRDVSPHNIIVGKDGVARVLDFGIAKAASRSQTTRDGQVKGKLAYMAPEQLKRKRVDRRTDIFAISVVLWEVLTGERLFAADDEGGTVTRILFDPIPPPSAVVSDLPKDIDAIVQKGLERDADKRFATAREMATALEGAIPMARPAEIGAYVEKIAAGVLAERAQRVAEIEGTPSEVGDSVSVVLAREDGGNGDPTGTMQLPADDRTNASQITNLSSVSSIAPRRGKRLVAAAVAVGLASAGGVAWLTLRGGGPEHPTPSAATELPSASALASIPSSSGIALQPPATEDAEAPPATAAKRAQTSHVPHTTPKSKAPTNACDPPFFIDSTGVKRFKPQCV
jgi:serine/threonine protein kinase